MKDCPVCSSEVAKNVGIGLIYCTGCSLSMESGYKDMQSLEKEWDLIAENVLKNLAKTATVEPKERFK